jgi:hypothetical protein
MGEDNPQGESRWLSTLGTLSRLAGAGITAAGGSLGPVLLAGSSLLGSAQDRRRQRALASELPPGSDEARQAALMAEARDLTPGAFSRLMAQARETRAATMLPSLLRGVEDVETIRPARQEPTLRFPAPLAGPSVAPVTGPLTREELIEKFRNRGQAAPGTPLAELNEAVVRRLTPPEPEAAEVREFELMGPPVPGTVETEPAEQRRFTRMPTLTEALGRVSEVGDETTRAALIRSILASKLPTERALPGEVEQARSQEAIVQGLLTSGRAKDRPEAEAIARTATVAGAKPGFEAFVEPRVRPSEKLAEAAAVRAHNARVAFLETVAPEAERRIEALGEHPRVSPADLELLGAYLDHAKADPSPENIRRFNAALAQVNKGLTEREQFAQRMDLLEGKISEDRQRFDQALHARNLAAAEASVKFSLGRIDREIARLDAAREFADPVTAAQLGDRINMLERRGREVEAWLDETTELRAAKPGATVQPPGLEIPPSREPGAGRRQEFQDKGLLR